MASDDKSGMDRREFLRKAAITGAVAWAVPAIQTVAASPAYASHSPTPTVCEHSPIVGREECETNPCHCLGEDCMSTCKCVCLNTASCAKENAGKCQQTVCGVVCSGGTCCANACNQSAYTCTNCTVTFAGC
jgi:hypothetical protein